MSFSPRQFRAIGSYCKSNGMRPELTTYPQVRMTEKATGKVVSRHIDDLVELYDIDLKEAARERARAKRAEQKLRGRS